MVAHRLLNEKEKRRIKIKINNKNEQKGIWLKDAACNRSLSPIIKTFQEN